MAHPLVRQLGLQEIEKRDAALPPPPRDITEEAGTALAGHVRASWGRNKLAKMKVDQLLLECLRARRGVYSPAALARLQQNGGMNIVHTDLSEVKCKAGAAWIRDIVLPVGERPWAVEPTPLPELPSDLKASILTKAVEQAKQWRAEEAQRAAEQTPDGQVVGTPVTSLSDFKRKTVEFGSKLRTEAELTIRKLADERARRMERQIDDRFAEGGWAKAMDAFVEEFVTYPAAVVKGPVYQRIKTLKWDSNGWTPKVTNDPAQSWESVSAFDVYPAPGAMDCQHGDFIERMRMWRTALYDLKGLPGFQDEQIDLALRDYSNGHLEGWLWTDAERQRLTSESMYMWLSPPGVIDAINYWGSVPGWKLMSWGVGGERGDDGEREPLEPTRDYECNVIIVGRYVIYAALNTDPLAARPYRKACYDEMPGSFWGRSVPDLVKLSQKMTNAIACAMADNFSMASGPMVWVHSDRLADGENTVEIFPFKVWQLKSDPTQGTNPGIGIFTVPDNSANLNANFEAWERRADDSSGIPRYTYGNENAGGAADTASGLAMLMNSAAKGLRRAIGNIDANIIQPNVMATFVNEMLYNDDESIKGDCKAVARGAAAILIKDAAQQRRIQFLGMTANPIDMQIIGIKGRAALLRDVAKTMDLPTDAVVPDAEAIEKMQADQAQQAQAQMQAQQQAAQAEAQTRMAIERQKIDAAGAQQQAAAGQRQEEQVMKLVGDIVKAAMSNKSGAEQPQAIEPASQAQVARSAV